jgi:UDP-N-acetylglucosamine 2-epimerase (non-hydrolysing)
MQLPRVLLIAGTRPEAIKLAPLVPAFRRAERLEPIFVSSGQHPAMVEQALDAFSLSPDVRLEIDRPSGEQAELLSALLPAIDQVIVEHAPAAVIVQGDTSTTLAGALAAFWRRIPIVHVEAGLRSGDLAHPFPEEANRRLVTQIASLHLPPTPASEANLVAEGVPADQIIMTGNTVVDAVINVAARALPYNDTRLEELDRSASRLILVTAHRRESWGQPLANVLRAIARIVDEFPDVAVVLPAHPNPAVREQVEQALSAKERVLITSPLPYASVARLLARSHLVLSDSGGIQEEAPSFGVPVLVLRNVTERQEAVEAGTALLVGTDSDQVFKEAARLLADDSARAAFVSKTNPFGDGHAATRTEAAVAALVGAHTSSATT